MNFQAMRKDGYSDTDIVESLRSSELFRDTADFDGLRKKGFDDTKIIDFLDATPSFHEVTTARREKAKATQPTQTPIAPQNNEGDVEGLGDTAVPTPPTAPAQEPKDDSFLGTIKSAGKALLEGLGFVSDIVTGDMGDAMMSAGQKVLKEKAKDMPEEKRASWNQGIDDLGTLNRNLNDPIDGLMNENTQYTAPAGTTKEQAVQMAKLYNPTEKSITQSVSDWVMGEDNPNGISEDQVKSRIENVAKILNKPIDDVVIDTNPKSETYGVPYVKGENGEFLSTKSESVWQNISTEMEADFPTILAQIFTDKKGWDAGGAVGDKLAKFIPNKFLAGATKLGGRLVGSAVSSTLATPAGTAVQKAQNAFETGVYEDGDAYVSEAWRDMKDNFAATVAGGVALEGVVGSAKGVKNVYTATKDFVTGEDRAYIQTLKDFKVDEQYAKDSLNELNQMLQNPLEDSKQARIYAMALKHPQGLEVLRESMRRNTTAYNNVENEILQRSEQLKGLLDDKTLKAGELQGFLDDAEKDASKQYQAMRLALREQTAGAKVVIDQEAVASTIESLLPKVINEEGKKSIENLVSLIRGAEYLTQNVDGLLELRHLVNRRMRKANIAEDFAPNDFAIVKGLLDGIDQTIYKTIDDTVSPEDAKTLKNIFETAKIDYSTQKRAEASSFFKKITTEGLSHSDRVNRLAKGLKADDESSDFVLSRLSSEQRERLELTAIHETIMKNLSGEQGGVQAMNHTKVLKNLEELSANMKSSSAKETIDMLTKLGSIYAKDRALLINVADHKTHTLALSPQGRLEFSIMSRVFEFVERRSPFMGDKGRRLQLYHRLGKYMETSHNTKELALKMYNDPLATFQDKAWWGKYIRYYNDTDSDGMAQLMETIPEPPKGGGSGLMDEAEIDELSRNGKTPTAEELKARLDDEAKAFKPDDTNPPDDNGGGGSPKPKEGADNGVQGQEKEVMRQSVEEIEATTGKTLDQLGDEDGFYTHYSTHEFDTLSSNGAKDAGNLGQTKGKETTENHVINVTFGYKQGARVENEHGIGLAGQHEYKIDLRGREFLDDDKRTYFFRKVQELKDASPELSAEALHVKAKEALGYDDATVDTIVDFQKRYNAMRQANPNQTTKDTQNSVLKEMKLDGIKNKNHLEILDDAPVYKVRTLEHDIDYAGMARPRSMDGLPPVSGEGSSYANRLYGTIETTPSKSNPSNIDPFNEVLDTLSPQQRIDFEKEHLPLVQQLAEDLGLSVEAEVSHGAFAGQTNPNIIVHFKEFYAKSRFADKQFKFKDEYGNLSVQAKEQIEAFLVSFGKATNQDSVGWYAPIFHGTQEGRHGYATITQPLDPDQWKILYGKLRGEWGEITPVMHDGRIDFMNWGRLPDAQFREIVSNATQEFEKSGAIGNKIVQFDTTDNLISKDDYGVYSSKSGRPDIPTGDNRGWNDATQRFEQGVQDLRRGLQERPRLDGGQKTVQDPIGKDARNNGGVQQTRVTPQQAGEQLASDLKDAPASTFKSGYVRPEVLSFMTKTLTGATGGSLTEYDYNGDGKIDFKDRAIGAALGVVGFHALTSQPAFSAYKALAEHGIKQLETRAEQGDLVAQMALGTRYKSTPKEGTL